jgi:uncharacterized membrane protein
MPKMSEAKSQVYLRPELTFGIDRFLETESQLVCFGDADTFDVLAVRRVFVPAENEAAHRLAAYSDAVFAVIVTVMVLELKAPDQAALSALWPLWPTAISYVVSYVFIAIIWINHHYLMRFTGLPTLRLIWINFVHLFMVSLLPFATAWIARTRLASSPVVFYAGLFVCVDIAYNVFEREVLTQAEDTQISAPVRRMARRRSLVVLASFTAAMLVAFFAPRVGFGLICAALILHLRPEVRGTRP